MVIKQILELEQVENGFIVSFKNAGVTEKRVFTQIDGVFTFALGHFLGLTDMEVVTRENKVSKKRRLQERVVNKERFGVEFDSKGVQEALEATKEQQEKEREKQVKTVSVG